MKKEGLYIATTVILTLFVQADATTKNQVIKEPSRAELMAKAKARRAEAQRKLGGYLYAPSTGNVVRVCNLQNTIPLNEIHQATDKMVAHLGFRIEVCGTLPDDKRTAAMIELVENGTDPTLLIAPEDSFGRLNVARLTIDAPSARRLNQRFVKELWRVLCMTLGCYKSNYSPCIMRNIFSLSDLDKDPAVMPCPEVYDKVQSTCQTLNVDMLRKVSYKRACIEGWAPAPTNDIQKAIWEQVKADKERGPTNPLKIPMPKRK